MAIEKVNYDNEQLGKIIKYFDRATRLQIIIDISRHYVEFVDLKGNIIPEDELENWFISESGDISEIKLHTKFGDLGFLCIHSIEDK